MSHLAKSPAEQFFAKAMHAVAEARTLLLNAKLRALASGRLFREAKRVARHGEWETLCEHYQVSSRHVANCIDFIELAEQWVKTEKPTLKGAALDKAVDDAVMRSPKPMTQLLRDLGMVKEVGAYDAAAYEQKKLAGTPQLVFAFEHFESQVRALVQTKQVFELSRSSLLKLKTELEEARAKVEEALAGKEELEEARA